MPALKPIKRRELIYFFKKLGFDGPYSGGKHQFMIKGDKTITIPNLHKEEIGKELLIRILKEAGINKEDWMKL